MKLIIKVMPKLKKMDFTDFVEFLDKKNIEYELEEVVDIDNWFTVYTTVTPKSKKLKARFFDNDGGSQLF